jgi:hypothetical protein
MIIKYFLCIFYFNYKYKINICIFCTYIYQYTFIIKIFKKIKENNIISFINYKQTFKNTIQNNFKKLIDTLI